MTKGVLCNHSATRWLTVPFLSHLGSDSALASAVGEDGPSAVGIDRACKEEVCEVDSCVAMLLGPAAMSLLYKSSFSTAS